MYTDTGCLVRVRVGSQNSEYNLNKFKFKNPFTRRVFVLPSTVKYLVRAWPYIWHANSKEYVCEK